ncbi:MAG: HD domain-containing phosphohydrolase [Armatimonadota bacterium]|nr:HD domain-containing phosphohydrolase [Armatimonadota bacterium]
MRGQPLPSLRAGVLAVILLAMLPVAGLLLHTASRQRDAERARVQGDAQRLARAVAATQDRLIRETRQLLVMLSQIDSVREPDAARCGDRFVRTVANNPLYANLGVLDVAGRAVCAAVAVDDRIGQHVPLSAVLTERRFIVGAYAVAADGRPVLYLAAPVLDRGRIRAIVYAALDVARLNDLIGDFEMPAGALLAVTDRLGTIIARRPNPQPWLGRRLPEPALLSEMADRPDGTAEITGPDGVRRLYGFTATDGVAEGLRVVVGIHSDAALAEINEGLRRNLLGLLGVSVLAIVAAWAGGSILVMRPVRELLRVVTRQRDGVTGIRASGSYPRGEIGELARAFDEMASSLADREQRLRALLADVQRSHAEVAQVYETTLEGWSRALDLRDRETEGHTLRVTEMTVRLARAVGMRDDEIVHVRRGALLHDIGKIGVPDRILLKAAPLTDEEWEVMRRHPVYAYEMLSPIAHLRPALDIPYAHHERWDGTGYPGGLRGPQIPLAARVFAVVDVWDALRSDRPYRRAWSDEMARAYIAQQAGRQFDPEVVRVFLNEVLPTASAAG